MRLLLVVATFVGAVTGVVGVGGGFLIVPALVLLASVLALVACGRKKPAVTGKVQEFTWGPLPDAWKKTDVKGLSAAYYHSGYGATAGIDRRPALPGG